MDDFSSISLLSLAMLVGCYVAGTIPLAVNFSEVRLLKHTHVFTAASSKQSIHLSTLALVTFPTKRKVPIWYCYWSHIMIPHINSNITRWSVLNHRCCFVLRFCLWLFVQEKLKLITVLGAGLLCGTALAVIIPEGVHALYEEILEGRVHQKHRTIN